MSSNSAILGSWENISNENLDEYLQAIGAGVIKRTLASNYRQTITISERDDGKITIRFKSAAASIAGTFELGVEFEHCMAFEPHIKTKNLITVEDGNKLVQKITVLNTGVEAIVVCEFNGDEMHSTATTGSIVATGYYRKID